MALVLLVFVLMNDISYAQSLEPLTNKSCLKYYTFENESMSPKFDLQEGWRRLDVNPHTGKMSLVSQLSAREISRLSLAVPGQKDVSFWWNLNTKDNSRFLFRVGDEPRFKEYMGSGWYKVNISTCGADSNMINWVFYAGSEDNIAEIDDICIKDISCDMDCIADYNLSLQPYEAKEKEIIERDENRSEQLSEINQLVSIKPYEPLKDHLASKVTNPGNNYSSLELLSDINLTGLGKIESQNFFVIQNCTPQPPYIFSSIQEAINIVPIGSTVNIIGDEFEGNIIINKSINLVGLDAGINNNNSDIGIHIKSDDVSINQIKFSGGLAGIFIENANRCDIKNNVFEKNKIGILIRYSENSNITNNMLRDVSMDAIRSILSFNNIIENNSIIKANAYGINLDRSDFNIIRYNILNDTYEDGIFLNESDENSVFNNTYFGRRGCDVFTYNSYRNYLDQKGDILRCDDPDSICTCHRTNPRGEA